MKSLILLLIAMSAAGTFPFIIYIALSTIFDNYISARFRYRCLKYCLLLCLVPFPLLKYFIYHRYFSTPKPLNGNVVISLTGKIVQTSTGFYLNSVGSLQKIFIGLWICSLSIIIFYKASPSAFSCGKSTKTETSSFSSCLLPLQPYKKNKKSRKGTYFLYIILYVYFFSSKTTFST